MMEAGTSEGASDLAKMTGRIARGGAATLGAQAVKFLIRVASQVLVARLLTPADYGLIAMVFPVISLVQIISALGLGQATIIQQKIDQEDVSALFWLGLGLNLAMCLFFVAISPLIGLMYRSDAVVPVAISLALLIPIAGLAAQPYALLSRSFRFQSMALMDIVPPAAGLVVAYCAALSGWKYWALVAGTACETVMTVTVIWVMSRWLPSWPKFSRRIWSLVRSGGDLTIFNLAVYATTSVDNMLLGVTRGQVALGLYDKGYKLVTQPLSQVTSPIDRITIPPLVKLHQDPDGYRRLFQGMLAALMVGLLPGVAFVMMDAQLLTGIALGKNWTSIAPVVSWLCVGALAVPLNSGVSWLFKSQNRTQEQLRMGLVVTAVSIASFVAGLPWGAVGVATGAGLSFLFVCVPVTCWAAVRAGPVTAKDLIGTIWPIAFATAAVILLLAGWSRLRLLDGWLALPIDLALSYAAFLAIFMITPSGRAMAKNFWRLRTKLRV